MTSALSRGEEGAQSRNLFQSLWVIYICCFGATREGRSGSWPVCISAWSWDSREEEGSWYGPRLQDLCSWCGKDVDPSSLGGRLCKPRKNWNPMGWLC